MKFLIAASFLCLALVGQIQGGSLRGLAVPVPHQVYGVPEIHVEEQKPIIEEKDTTIVEVPEIKEPSVEYGAPVVSEVQTVPFIDSLPLVDSVVSFVNPEPIPAKPQVDLPYLQPGLPALPEAPVVPVYVEEPMQVNEVSNEYLPPAKEIVPSPVVIEEHKPSEVYGPPPVVVPVIPELPVLPPKPLIVEEIKPHVEYGPPAVEVKIPELPIVEEVKPSEVYGPPPTPAVEYGPPVVPVKIPELPIAPPQPVIVEEIKPEIPRDSEVIEVPTIPELPVVPDTPVIPIVEEVKPGYHYKPGMPAFELPKVTIHAPSVPIFTKDVVVVPQPAVVLPEVKKGYHYEVPAKEFITPFPNLHGLVSGRFAV